MTLEGIRDDPNHNSASSSSGGTMVRIAKDLLSANLALIHTLLITHFVPLLSSSSSQGHLEISSIFKGVSKLRGNPTFLVAMCDAISSISPNVRRPLVCVFLQRFVSNTIKAYFTRQNELMRRVTSVNVDAVTENDKQVLYYICGYIIHALRKKYMRLKSAKAKRILDCLGVLEKNSSSDDVSSAWTDALDRGGLKRPCLKFFKLIMQIEKWLRDIVSIKYLKSDTLVNLKARLLDYNLLKASWNKIIDNGHYDCNMIMLEHVLALFLKVRGFAITKLYRKTLLMEKKKTKAAKKEKAKRPGAIRQKLKSMNELNL